MSKDEILIIPKTIEGLRDALFEELQLLREGKSNPQKSRAVAQMADKIIDSMRVQIQYGRLIVDQEKKYGTTLLGSNKKN